MYPRNCKYQAHGGMLRRTSGRKELRDMVHDTHILLQKGTQISCSIALPTQYKINNKWYKIIPKPIETISPVVINPMINITVDFNETIGLGTNGIYSMKDLEELRNYINFTIEKPAILNTIARKIGGKPTIHQGGSFYRLLDPDSIKKQAENTWSSIWEKFMTFGTISAGIMAIFVILQFIKLIIDSLIRRYTLYSIYGWSIRIFGAIFASITALLVHLGNSNTANRPPPPDVEMGRIPYEMVPTEPEQTKKHYPDLNAIPGNSSVTSKFP